MTRLANPAAVARFADDNVAHFPNEGGGGDIMYFDFLLTTTVVDGSYREAQTTATLQDIYDALRANKICAARAVYEAFPGDILVFYLSLMNLDEERVSFIRSSSDFPIEWDAEHQKFVYDSSIS